MAERETPARRRRLQAGSLVAVPAVFAMVLLAQVLEGGAVGALLHGAAALVVVGGTAAATLITYSPGEMRAALRAAARSFVVAAEEAPGRLTADLVRLSVRGHRHGLLALDADLDGLDDPFLRNGLSLVVDGIDAATLRQVLDAESRAREAQDGEPARLFEAAAGYAPIFGILGAALGLIQVMRHLASPSGLGAGIAVAFVATVYGLGFANMLLLPMAGRLRERAARAVARRQLVVEGLLALQQRTHPRVVAQTMRAMAPGTPPLAEVARQSRDVLHAVEVSS